MTTALFRPGTMVTPISRIYVYRQDGVSEMFREGETMLIVGYHEEKRYLVMELVDSSLTSWHVYFHLRDPCIENWLRVL